MSSGKRTSSWHVGATLTTAFSMALVLLLVGAMAITTIVAVKLTQQMQESTGVNLSIANNVLPEQIDSLSASINAMNFTSSTHVVTRSEALQQWKDETGEDLIELLGENPLNATIVVNVNAPWACSDSLDAIKQRMEQMPGVIDAVTSTRDIDNIVTNAQHLLSIIAVSAGTLFIIAIALIMSVVRLQTISQRFHIHTMTLVGATPWFIVKPYMMRGALMGLIAATMASAVMTLALSTLSSSRDPFYHALSLCLSTRNTVMVMALMALLGIVMGAIATGIAAWHYTRSSQDELYAE